MLRFYKKPTSAISAWVSQLAGRVHPNVAAVALANKMARIIWAVRTKGEEFKVKPL